MSGKQTLYEGRFLHLVKKNNWEYVSRPNITGIAAMVPITQENKLVILEQYRRPVDNLVIEFPAGLVGDVAAFADETIELGANRELIEETGYEAGELHHLFDSPPSPGICSEIISWYLAVKLTKVGPGGGDETEDIRIHEVSLADAHAFLGERQAAGCLLDPKVFLGLYYAQRYLTGQSIAFS